MAAQVDPRSVETARFRVESGTSESARTLEPDTLDPDANESDPDNEATDLSMQRLDPIRLTPSDPSLQKTTALPLDVTPLDNLPVEEPSPWEVNGLAAVLLTALVCAIAICGVLGLKLSRARADLAEAEAAAEAAESAVAREPAEEEKAPAHAATKTAPEQPTLNLIPDTHGVTAAEAPPERLLLLLTVGSQHYAEKQTRALKQKCNADLAVYRQKRGRCAFEQCFVVATPASEAEAARGCGHVKGQALRDREDFAVP